MQKFVILTRPRSGSNYLCSRLDGLEDVVCDGELFHPRHIAYTDWPRQTSPAGRDSDSQRIERRNTDVAGFIRARAASVARSAEPRAWGFKHIVEHGGAVIDAIDADSDFRVLCLVRQAPFAEYVSRVKAFETGQWFLRPGEHAKSHKIVFHLGHYMEFLVRRGKELRRLRRLVHRKRPNALWLSYESLTSRDGWSHVASFLDVELRESYVGTSRQSSGQPYDEVHNMLAAKLLVGILQISGAQAVAQTQVGFLTLRAVRRIARAAGGRGAGEIVQ